MRSRTRSTRYYSSTVTIAAVKLLTMGESLSAHFTSQVDPCPVQEEVAGGTTMEALEKQEGMIKLLLNDNHAKISFY